MAKRPENICESCGHTWYPKGHNLSKRCPECHSTKVKIHRNFFIFWILLHLIVFSAIINVRSDLSFEGILNCLKIKRGWPGTAQIDVDAYLIETAIVFLLSGLVYFIPIVVSIFKSSSDDATDVTEAVIANSVSPQIKTNSTKRRYKTVNNYPDKTANAFETNMIAYNSSQKSRRKGVFEFDVALSYASEDRECANQIAELLKKQKISVFYDDYERSSLWGQDLYQYLTDVYQNKAKYCLIFVSKHYARKRWTNLECKAAQARAFEENNPYILPIKLDDTEIPGILPTVGFLSWQKDGAHLIVAALLDKLNNSRKIN